MSYLGCLYWFSLPPHLVRALILGVMALLFEISDIIELVIIGVLLAYTLGTFSVLILR